MHPALSLSPAQDGRTLSFWEGELLGPFLFFLSLSFRGDCPCFLKGADSFWGLRKVQCLSVDKEQPGRMFPSPAESRSILLCCHERAAKAQPRPTLGGSWTLLLGAQCSWHVPDRKQLARLGFSDQLTDTHCRNWSIGENTSRLETHYADPSKADRRAFLFAFRAMWWREESTRFDILVSPVQVF